MVQNRNAHQISLIYARNNQYKKLHLIAFSTQHYPEQQCKVELDHDVQNVDGGFE